jgi:hypothetical protein
VVTPLQVAVRRVLLAVAVTALFAPAAHATPVATNDSQYSSLGRVFPDPLAGCRAGPCSPNAQGNVPATQFIQYTEFVDAMRYMNTKAPWSRYMEVWPLDGKLGDGAGSGRGGDAFPGNDLGRLEFDPKAEYQSAGIPTTDIGRKKSDLFVVRVTDESVPDANKERYVLSLSIHGIERAGLEGGTRAVEDLVSASTTGKRDDPIVPRQVDRGSPTIAEVLRRTIIYFTYPNPDGWRRGSVSEGGVFFQRYNGNGVDLNRDWPDIGFSYRPYSGLSEPESRALAAFFDDVKGQTRSSFAAGDDLHGQLTADALSFTLLPHGKHDLDKDLRIRDTAVAIHRNSERALAWSPIIQPNSAPTGGGLPCAPSSVAPGESCARIYGQTWGTVYDTINYTTTGALGDYFDSSIGLGADGIDNEMSFSHLDKNIVFDPHTEQLHVDGNKALIYSHLAQLSHPVNRVMDLPGQAGYVPNARLGRQERSFQPGAPPGTQPQADVQGQLGSPSPDGVAFPFEVQRSGTIFNGGMRVDITKESLQGISESALTLKVQCKGCDEHPGVKETGEWVTVAEDFNQSPIYLQAGLTAAVNRPQAFMKVGGAKVEWRALLEGPALARMNVDFTSGPATTDATTGGGDPPRLAGYDVANTDFFRDLNGFMHDPDERLARIDPRRVIAGKQSLKPLKSVVLADDALPGSYNATQRQAWFDALRAYVEGGGNLVLTDGALLALPQLTSVPADKIERRTVYVGQVSFAETPGDDTTDEPLGKNVRQPGARFNGGDREKRRQTFEPTPLGFSIQNATTGANESHAHQLHVDKAAFKAAGGKVVATSATAAPSATADFDKVTVGEFRRGKGTIRVAGALLPQPSTRFDHPFGVEPYALTYTGYTLVCNLIECTIRESRLSRCVRRVNGVKGPRLGPARLGRTRRRQRRAIGARLLSRRGGIDRYCVQDGGVLRIGYPTRRLNRGLGRRLRRRVRSKAQVALTSNPRASIRGIRRGTRVRTLRRRLRGERRYRVGRNTWYVARRKRARLLFKTRRGRVREIGIASRRLSRTRRGTRRLLRAWQL